MEKNFRKRLKFYDNGGTLPEGEADLEMSFGQYQHFIEASNEIKHAKYLVNSADMSGYAAVTDLYEEDEDVSEIEDRASYDARLECAEVRFTGETINIDFDFKDVPGEMSCSNPVSMKELRKFFKGAVDGGI